MKKGMLEIGFDKAEAEFFAHAYIALDAEDKLLLDTMGNEMSCGEYDQSKPAMAQIMEKLEALAQKYSMPKESMYMLFFMSNFEKMRQKYIQKGIGDLFIETAKDFKYKLNECKKDYCLASDIAEELNVYSENNLPHSNFVGAIARILGMKISYKHYYEDEKIAIVPDISKGNQYYQVYYKNEAVKEIIEWFDKNKEEIEYKIIYEKNTENGKRGEIKEKGYKIENVCYKVKMC